MKAVHYVSERMGHALLLIWRRSGSEVTLLKTNDGGNAWSCLSRIAVPLDAAPTQPSKVFRLYAEVQPQTA